MSKFPPSRLLFCTRNHDADEVLNVGSLKRRLGIVFFFHPSSFPKIIFKFCTRLFLYFQVGEETGQNLQLRI
jgi:hypothetical protein